MVKGRNGKNLLMLNGYTYYQHKILRDGFRWSCTQMGSRSCRGFLHVTKEMLVIRAKTQHTHPPSRYLFANIKKDSIKNEEIKKNCVDKDKSRLSLKIASIQGRAVEFYLRPNGRINLRLNNFTFYKHLKARSNAHRWSCTAYGSKWKCKAHLIITDKLEVLKANVYHSHPPSMKKEARTSVKPNFPWNGTGNKENGMLMESRNGKTMFVLEGHTFCKQKLIRGGEASRWICSLSHRCNVYVHLDHDYQLLFKSKQIHTHPPRIFDSSDSRLVKPVNVVRIQCLKTCEKKMCSDPTQLIHERLRFDLSIYV
ncbi:unnamed protein product, partial [Brenthis ino]